MKARRIWAGLVLVALLVTVGVVFLLLGRDRITQASWEKIHIGMTEKEVEAILGGPGMNDGEFYRQMQVLEKKAGKRKKGSGVFVWMAGKPIRRVPAAREWQRFFENLVSVWGRMFVINYTTQTSQTSPNTQ